MERKEQSGSDSCIELISFYKIKEADTFNLVSASYLLN